METINMSQETRKLKTYRVLISETQHYELLFTAYDLEHAEEEFVDLINSNCYDEIAELIETESEISDIEEYDEDEDEDEDEDW